MQIRKFTIICLLSVIALSAFINFVGNKNRKPAEYLEYFFRTEGHIPSHKAGEEGSGFPSDIDLTVWKNGFDVVRIGEFRSKIEAVIGETNRPIENRALERDFVAYPEAGVLLVYDAHEDKLLRIELYSGHEKSESGYTRFRGAFRSGLSFEKTPEEVKNMFGEQGTVNDLSDYVKVIINSNLEIWYYADQITKVVIRDPLAPSREYFRKEQINAGTDYNPPMTLQGWGNIRLGASRLDVESILGAKKRGNEYFNSRPDVAVRYSDTDDTVVRLFIVSEFHEQDGRSLRTYPPLRFENGLGFYEATMNDIIDFYGSPDHRLQNYAADQVTFQYGNADIQFKGGYASGFSVSAP